MRFTRCLPLALVGLAHPAVSVADLRGDRGRLPGSLVQVEVEVGGRPAPLYAAVDGSGRFYLEAREGERYAVRIANRTRERLGVLLTVDGLNAISGELDRPASVRAPHSPGRMYVLDPWEATTVQGWRTSLDDVRRFTFVDERASYAARSGRANSRMGWIEVRVHRERRPRVQQPWRERDRIALPGESRSDREDSAGAQAAPATEAPPPAAAEETRRAPRALGRDQADAAGALGRRESYPGTGWGPRAHDPVVVVDFDPEPHAAERITLRYEYARALHALGVLPRPWPTRDRLSERERGGDGFARPPAR
jgi:hypothetical protein